MLHPAAPRWLLAITIAVIGSGMGCSLHDTAATQNPATPVPVSSATDSSPLPLVGTTAPVANDADDPAVWVNRRAPAASLIIGTNKAAAPDGALYVFDMDGRVTQVIAPLDRPNNVDVEYGLVTDAGPIDLVVVTERLQNQLRVYKVDDTGLTPVDGGGLKVLDGMTGEAAMPMGIALYKRPRDGAIFAIVAPKTGGATDYLWEYRLAAGSDGVVRGTLVRRFGHFSGTGEIEAVVVDDELGYVYYSDEEYGIRKWLADPDHEGADMELAVFGRGTFKLQREGLAILRGPNGTGFIVASDQIPDATALHVFRREGRPGAPHAHDPEVAVIPTTADSTDGLEVVADNLGPRFPEGVLLMMHSKAHVFNIYDLRALKIRLPR